MESAAGDFDKKERKEVYQKYMTFTLANETYGIDINNIKEIIEVMEFTIVPRMPEYIKDVINLRGKIIPVIDMRLKIGFEKQEYDDRTCIIIVEIRPENQLILVGLVVDRVLEVTNIGENILDPSPDFGFKINTSFISGLAKMDNNVVIALLNIEDLLTAEDIEMIQTAEDIINNNNEPIER